MKESCCYDENGRKETKERMKQAVRNVEGDRGWVCKSRERRPGARERQVELKGCIR